jgi:class 3 adenylate cyclase
MPLSFPRKGAEIAGIKTTNEENIPIAWRPKLNLETPAFPEFPAHALGVLPNNWFKDKIVLVGAKLSLEDRHRTPLAIVDDGWEGKMPGVIIHAHALSQFLEQREPYKITTNATFIACFIMALIGMGIGLAKKGVVFSVVGGIISAVLLWVGSFVGFSYGLTMIPLVAPTITLALALWMMDLIIGKAERQQRQFVQGAFSRYVAPAVVDKLVENPESLSVTGVRQQTTFIFSDIAGFTTLSENLTSEKLSSVLNDYLEGACQIVFKHGGTVDKFIGDAIMAVFNAPIKQVDHVERAVSCALDLDDYCEKFRINQNKLGVPVGLTRIGVHTGIATVGNFGSNARMDFTALGDTVNTAARTESVNKYFGTRLAATQEIVSDCKGLFFSAYR